MNRVIADANVVVSAALARSPQAPSALILDSVLDGRLSLVTSPMLIAEIGSVLRRPRLRRYLSIAEAERFVSDLAGQSELTQDAPRPFPAVCRDAADDYLVALALQTAADVLVTGDLDLLDLEHPDVRVLTPRQFYESFVADQ